MANVNVVANACMARHVHDPNSLGYSRTIYTPIGGSASYVDAIVHYGEGYQELTDEDGITVVRNAELEVDAADVTGLRSGDKFRIDGVDFKVEHVPQSKALGLASIVVSSFTRFEKSDGGTRRRER